MGVDANGPAAGFVHALEDVEYIFDAQEPEGEGGEHEPETVDDAASRAENKGEGEGFTRTNIESPIDQCGVAW